MNKIFDDYGIEVFSKDDKYFIKYDEGEIIGKIRMMEISKEDALLVQKSEYDAYQVIIKYQNR